MAETTKVVAKMRSRAGKGFSIVAVAEGAMAKREAAELRAAADKIDKAKDKTEKKKASPPPASSEISFDDSISALGV